MNEDTYEFEDDLYIDLNRLEWEVARQAKLFGKWAKRWAQACKRRDRLQENVKTVRSEAINYLRLNYLHHDFVKEPTAPQSEAHYRTDPNYKEAKRKAIKAEGEVNMLYAAMRSFEHKRTGLTIEEKLYSQDYFSTPYDVPEFREKSQKEMTEAQEESLGETDRIPKKLVRR
jgi:hypothetical protein